eukprot:gene5538-3994_t
MRSKGMHCKALVVVGLALLVLLTEWQFTAAMSDADAHFDMLEDTDLRQILYEKAEGKVALEQFRTRESLIHAIKKFEKKKEEGKAFRDRVEAALTKTPKDEVFRYQKYYEEMRYELQRSLPPGRRFYISGDHYPVPLGREILSSCTTIAFMVALLLFFLGHQMTFLPASVRTYVSANGGVVVGGAVLLFMVGNSLRQTGAFEVYVNNEKVFSKLETGSVPSPDDLYRRIMLHTILRHDILTGLFDRIPKSESTKPRLKSYYMTMRRETFLRPPHPILSRMHVINGIRLRINGFGITVNSGRNMRKKKRHAGRATALPRFEPHLLLAVQDRDNVAQFSHLYGYLIHEFDPWFNYRATKYLSENGWHAFFHWFDRKSWYPLGRPVGTTIYPGLQITAVAIHRVLQFAGYPISILHVCVLMPAGFAMVATAFVILMTYEITLSMSAVLVSSITFSIIPAHTMRSMAGEFDNECIAVAAMLATFYFWVRSLRTASSWPFGIVAGLSYGYMVAAWGGFIFVLNMVALHAGAMIVLDWLHNRYSASLTKAYGLFFVVGTGIAVCVPPVGLTPFKSLEQLSAVVVLLFLVALHGAEGMRKKADAPVLSWACLRIRFRVLSTLAVGLIAVVAILAPTGYFGPISSRVRALFVKHTRTGNPLVDSVAEHQGTNVKTMLVFFHLLLPLSVVGCVSAPFISSRNAAGKVFFVLYTITSLLFAWKMRRLAVLAAPAVCVMSAVPVGKTLDWCWAQYFWNKERQTPDVLFKRRSTPANLTDHEGGSRTMMRWPNINIRGPIMAVLVTLVLLASLGAWDSFAASSKQFMALYSNPRVVFLTYDSQGQRITVKDYLDSYLWLKRNTPEDARILSWWDYGYQITGIGDRTTLADGNTWNHEHIATLGKMLTSPIHEAHSLVRHMADYVFISRGSKSNSDLEKPLCTHFGFYNNNASRPTSSMKSSLIYRLYMAGVNENISVPLHLFQEVYSSAYGLVRIYKVMNVSEESKAWVADPANHVCSKEDSWICPGQYPPAKEIQEMLAKRVDFPAVGEGSKQISVCISQPSQIFLSPSLYINTCSSMFLTKAQYHISFALLVVLSWQVFQACLFNNNVFKYTLHKIEPWFNYRAASYLSENGWHAFFHWFDRKSWYPLGRPVGTTIYPGLQITAVAIHRVLQFAGYPISLLQVCSLLPAWCFVVSTTCMYGLALEVLGNPLSAVGTAAECIAVAAMLATFYFWVRSLRTASSWPFGIVAGLSYGYMASSFEGHTFPLNVIALHAGAIAVRNCTVHRYSSSLTKAYGLFFVVGTGIAVCVPPVGLTPFKSLEQLSAVVVLLLLVALHGAEKRRIGRGEVATDAAATMRVSAVVSATLLLAVAIAILSSYGLFFLPLRPSVAALLPGMSSSMDTFLEQSTLQMKSHVTNDFLFMMYQSPGLLSVVAVPLLTLWSRSGMTPARLFALIAVSLALFFIPRTVDGELYAPMCALGTGAVVHLAISVMVREMRGGAVNKVEETEKALEQKKKKGKKDKRNQNEASSTEDEGDQQTGRIDLDNLLAALREKSPLICWILTSIPVFAIAFVLIGSGAISDVGKMLPHFSNPGVVYFNYTKGNAPQFVGDYLESFTWVNRNTALDARVFTPPRSSILLSSIGNRTAFGVDDVPDASYHAKSAKIFLSSPVKSHRWLRHLADYILIWTGAPDQADYVSIPYLALVSNDFYLDVCPGDPDCSMFFPDEDRKLGRSIKQSLLYQLTFHGTETNVSSELFQEVYTSKNALVRIYKVMNVSEESKAWVADPANHVCSKEDSWICPGHVTNFPLLRASHIVHQRMFRFQLLKTKIAIMTLYQSVCRCHSSLTFFSLLLFALCSTLDTFWFFTLTFLFCIAKHFVHQTMPKAKKAATAEKSPPPPNTKEANPTEDETKNIPLLLGTVPVPKKLFSYFFNFVSVVGILYGCVLAFTVRMYSVQRFGYLIHEFDPWFNYRATKYLSENGWHAFFHWFDRKSWYPLGRPVGTTIYPGLQITAVAIHRILQFAGYPTSLNVICVCMPAWFGSVATLFAAMLAYEMNGSMMTAAVTAITFSIIPAHTMRSMAGEFDNECIAVAAMLATFYFWVRSLRTASSWPFGIVAGLSYGYMVAAWGGFIFVLNMVALHAGAMIVLDWLHNRYSASLTKAYGLFFVVGTGIAVCVPPVGLTPFKSLEQLSAVVVLLFLVALHGAEGMRKKADAPVLSWACLRIRFRVLSTLAVGLIAVVAILAPTGYFGPISSRVRALFVKHTRTGNPLVDSVAEHQPTSDGAYKFFLMWCRTGWAIAVFFLGVDCVLRPIPSRVFMLLYSIAAFYFSRRMSRLVLLAGPVACGSSGFLIGWFAESAVESLFWCRSVQSKKKEKNAKRKEYSVYQILTRYRDHHRSIWLVICWIVVAVSIYLLFGTDFMENNRNQAYALARPHIVFDAKVADRATGGHREIIVRDYLDSYLWLKRNTPEDARILSWWDYGYQITGIGDRTTLADGNTWNHEHIATLGKMLTSPIHEAHSLVRHMADYVLVWTGQNGDDLRKSPHMARIGNSVYRDICPKDPLCKHFGFYDHTYQRPSPTMRRSLLYHLATAGVIDGVSVPPHLFQEVYSSAYGLVRIYKVMNVSEESKAWVADPANHVCSKEDSWICPGQYPPAKEIQAMLAKRVDFSQLEDFNRGNRDDDYYKAYMANLKEMRMSAFCSYVLSYSLLFLHVVVIFLDAEKGNFGVAVQADSISTMLRLHNIRVASVWSQRAFQALKLGQVVGFQVQHSNKPRARCFSSSTLCCAPKEELIEASDVQDLERQEGEAKRFQREANFLETSTPPNESEDNSAVNEPTLADLDRSIPQVDCEFVASLVRCRSYQRSKFLEEKAALKQRVSRMTEDTSRSVLETSRFKLFGGMDLWSRGEGSEGSETEESSVVVSPKVLEKLSPRELDLLESMRPEYNDGFILLDCRTVNEVTSWGVIEDFEAAYGFPKPHPEDMIICYCQYGPRSLMAAQILSWMGYLKVLHFRDGYYEWGKQYNLLLRRWMEHDKTSGNELKRLAAFRAALEMQRDVAPEFNQLPMAEAAGYRIDVSRSPGTLRVGDGLRAEAYAAVASLAESLPLLEDGSETSSTGTPGPLVGEQRVSKFLEQATGINPSTESSAGTFALSDAQEASLQPTVAEHVDPRSSR